MAEFKDGSLWMKLVFIFSLLAFAQILLSYPSGVREAGGSAGAESCLIVAFLALITAVVLALVIVLLDEVAGNKIAKICLIVFALVAGVAELIGVALYNTRSCGHGNSSCFSYSQPEFGTLLAVFGAFCELLAGIFAILDLVGVGAGK